MHVYVCMHGVGSAIDNQAGYCMVLLESSSVEARAWGRQRPKTHPCVVSSRGWAGVACQHPRKDTPMDNSSLCLAALAMPEADLWGSKVIMFVGSCLSEYPRRTHG